MAGQSDEYVFRHLPGSYRRAGTEGPAYALTHMLGRTIGSLDRLSLQVMKSRFLEHVNDLDDAERLAALFELAPWPEEDLEAFRSRVRLMARIYLQGSATAERMLEVLGAAFDLELAELALPLAGGSDRYTTKGTFRKRGAETVSFSAEVVDLPLTVRKLQVTDPEFKWSIDNNLYLEPPSVSADGSNSDGIAPEPIFDIAAGDHPVILPVIMQQDSRRFVLINRIIPKGAAVRVDLRNRTFVDLTDTHTYLGPIEFNGSYPELLFGTGGIADTDAGQISGPAAKPFHVLHWSDETRQDPAMPEVPGKPGTLNPVPDGKLPWPPMVALGVTRWRLMRGATRSGGIPAPLVPLPYADMRVLPLTEDSKPSGMNLYWEGRQLGTFTIQYDEQLLGNGANSGTGTDIGTDTGMEGAEGAEPALSPDEQEHEQKRQQAWLKRRQEWLGKQIGRLKLAGVQYVEPDEDILAIPTPVTGSAPVIALTEMIAAVDSFVIEVVHDQPEASFSDTLIIADAMKASVGKPTGLNDELELTDHVDVEVTPGEPESTEHVQPIMDTLLPEDSVIAEVTLGEPESTEHVLELSDKLLPLEGLVYRYSRHQGAILNELLVLKDRLEVNIRSH